MATYLKGVKDYVPQLQTFKPDYKFLSDVLSVRQDRYDTNYKSLNDLYSKVVYADMSREDNNAQRDLYANQLSNGLKQVSGMDLSLAQNVDVAKGLFKPFFENKALVKDMTFTKMYQKESSKVNSIKDNSNEEIKENYWQDGVIDLQFQLQEYKEASPEQALQMGMPKYVNNPNLYKRSFEALKDSGLSIKQTTLEGDWIITTENGTALTRQLVGYEQNKNGSYKLGADNNPVGIYKNPAAEYLRETVMRDPVVIEGYRVQARNRGRQFSNNEENIQRYGSVDAASKAWAEMTIKNQTDKDSKILSEQNTAIKKEENTISNWEAYKRNNNIIPGSFKEEVFLKKIAELGLLKKTRDLTSKRLKEGKVPASDLKQLMNVAYGQYMATQMGPLMSKAAVAYSQIDASQTFEANPFKKMEHQHKYDMSKMRAKNAYDQANIRLKNKLENQAYGPAEGINPLSGPVSSNIGGRPLNQNEVIKGSEAILNAHNKVDQTKMDVITSTILADPLAFNDFVQGGQMTYDFKNVETGEVTQKRANLKDAFIDLAKPGQEVELGRIFKKVQSKFQNVETNKSGAEVMVDLPNLQNNPDLINNIRQQFNAIDKQEKVILKIEDQFQVRLKEALDFGISSGKITFADDVAIPMMTERQIAMAMDGRTNKEIKRGFSIFNPKSTQEDKYKNLDNSRVRLLSQEEYEDVYVAMMKLPPEQRAQLEAPNASGSRNDYDFLTTDFGFLNDTESTAEGYWNYIGDGSGSASFASPTTGIGVSTGIGTTGGRGIRKWRFNEAQARKDARKKYSDSDSELDESGNYTIGDAGFLGNINTVFTSPDAGGENGLPTYNVEAVLAGQSSNAGVGQAAINQYDFAYDQFSKSPESIEQINAMTTAFNSAPPNTVLFSIGDDRTMSITDIKDADNKVDRDLAKAIFEKLIKDTQFQYGKNNDREKRPVMNMSYVERMGGPDTEADYAGYTISPGSSTYGKEFEGLFGEDDPRYNDFLRSGITISIPSDYDSNKYSSKNQAFSAANTQMAMDGNISDNIIDGASYVIFPNPNGPGYYNEVTSKSFNKETGNISSDSSPSTQYLSITPSQLDGYIYNLENKALEIAKKNQAQEKSYKK